MFQGKIKSLFKKLESKCLVESEALPSMKKNEKEAEKNRCCRFVVDLNVDDDDHVAQIYQLEKKLRKQV